MKSMGVAEFKQRCLALIDELGRDGLVLTRHGRPIAKVIPWGRQNEDLLGYLEGEIDIHGDVFSTGEAWEADAEP